MLDCIQTLFRVADKPKLSKLPPELREYKMPKDADDIISANEVDADDQGAAYTDAAPRVGGRH